MGGKVLLLAMEVFIQVLRVVEVVMGSGKLLGTLIDVRMQFIVSVCEVFVSVVDDGLGELIEVVAIVPAAMVIVIMIDIMAAEAMVAVSVAIAMSMSFMTMTPATVAVTGVVAPLGAGERKGCESDGESHLFKIY